MNKQPWKQLQSRGLTNFTVWPLNSLGPFDLEGRRDYFDSMHHAAAVVGLNTSGQVEAGLIGKPVMTLVSEDIAHTTYGTVDTLHFHHLISVNGGLLHVARSFEEHLQQLSRAIAGDFDMAERSRRFTEAFIRPHGLAKPATPILAEAIRSVGSLKPQRRPIETAVMRPVVRGLLMRLFDLDERDYPAAPPRIPKTKAKGVS